MAKDYFQGYFEGATEIINRLDKKEIKKTLNELIKLKKRKGRLFLLGVGGSAANCSHAVNDFRKICGIEAYAPTDNVGELTARTNDDGWETVFVNWLKGSHLTKKDAVIVFSVGGGNLEKNISANIVSALVYAKKIRSTILGIVSRDGGYTKKVATSCTLIPVIDKDSITPYAEAFQAVVWHALVFHPNLRSIEPY
jgi:D-sedoheptulose 7-phosphate isomerase